MGGAREILVAESDVEAAEAIMAAVDEGAFESEDTPQT